MSDRTRVFDALLRSDLQSFIHRSFLHLNPGTPFAMNWHIGAIADHLQQVERGGILRLVISLPPRSLKSHCVSVAFPAWALGRNPSRKIIGVSYAGELSGQHARQNREIMDSAWFRRAFPGTVLGGKSTEDYFETTRGGSRRAVSTGGALTGMGGNILIIDDPLKSIDALSEARRSEVNSWFSNTLLSRLDDKRTGAIILVMQRQHVDDLTGHLLRDRDHGWTHLCIPAIAERREYYLLPRSEFVREPGELLHPEREPRERLEEARRAMTPHDFAAQYQQDPLPLTGNLVQWDWMRFFSAPFRIEPNDVITQSWDTASKDGEINDYSACLTFVQRGNEHYLLDIFRERMNYPRLKEMVVALRERWGAHRVLIEDAGTGTALIQELRDEARLPVIPVIPRGDKQTRLYRHSAAIAAGALLLPEGATWLEEFQRELLAFPHGRHDDQIDALSQYLDNGGVVKETLDDAWFGDGCEHFDDDDFALDLRSEFEKGNVY